MTRHPQAAYPPRALAGHDVSPHLVAQAYLAILDLDRLGERRTVRAVAHRLDVAASSALNALRALRGAGLISWEDGQMGTLRRTSTVHLPKDSHHA